MKQIGRETSLNNVKKFFFEAILDVQDQFDRLIEITKFVYDFSCLYIKIENK